MENKKVIRCNRHSFSCKYITIFILLLFSLFYFSAWADTEAGSVVVNGVSTLPLGWYAMHKSLEVGVSALGMTPLDESMQNGFDYVMLYFARDEGRDTVLNYMDKAQTRGIKVMWDMHPAKLTEITTWVNWVKHHPALYGYYLEDEPEIRDIPAMYLAMQK